MPQDSSLQFQKLLAKLEALDQSSTGDLHIQTLRSEIFQSILQLFAANLQGSSSAQTGARP